MTQQDGRHDAQGGSRDEEPDQEVEEYENDEAGIRASEEREAGLTAFGGPAFGELFGHHRDDGDFDAQHNP